MRQAGVNVAALVEMAKKQVHWLIDPKRGILLPLAGIWILGLDWLLFSSNVLSAGLATPVVVVLDFILGGIDRTQDHR